MKALQVAPHGHGVESAAYGVGVAGTVPVARGRFSVSGVVGRVVAAPALRT